MRYALIVLAAMVIWLGAGPMPAFAQSFISIAEDIPLSPSLTELEGEAMSFPTATGRLSEAVAQGRDSAAAIIKFYGATLPQLGWQAQSATVFIRDGEKLTIAPEQSGSMVVVRFSLSQQ